MGVIFRNGIPYGGGGGGEPIEAEENQILVGDGDDWAKGGPFYATKNYTTQTVNLEAQFDTDSQNVGTINICGNQEKSGTKMPLTGAGWPQKVPSLTLGKDSIAFFDGTYFKVIDSEICIAENSKIHIDGTQSSKNGVVTRNVSYPGPDITIHDNLVLSVNPLSTGGGQPFAPEAHFLGNFFISFSNKIVQEKNEYGFYQDAHSPGERCGDRIGSSFYSKRNIPTAFQHSGCFPGKLDGDKNFQGPWVKFEDAPFFSMVGTPGIRFEDCGNLAVYDKASLRFADNVTIDLDGNTDIKMRGNSQVVLQPNQGDSLLGYPSPRVYMTGSTGIWFEQGDLFITDNVEDKDSGWFACRGGKDGRVSNVWNSIGSSLNDDEMTPLGDYQVDAFDSSFNIYGQKRFVAELGSNDAFNIVRFGGDGGIHVYDFEPLTGNSIIKFAPAANFTAVIDPPSGYTYFKYSPTNQFYAVITPNDSVNLAFQPKGPVKSIVNSTKYYSEFYGNHHEDFWDNTVFIMRGEEDNNSVGTLVTVTEQGVMGETSYEGAIILKTKTDYGLKTNPSTISDLTQEDTVLFNSFLDNFPGNSKWTWKYNRNTLSGSGTVYSTQGYEDRYWYSYYFKYNYQALNETDTITLQVKAESGSYTAKTDIIAAINSINNQTGSYNNVANFILAYYGEDVTISYDEISFYEDTNTSHSASTKETWCRLKNGKILNAKARVVTPKTTADYSGYTFSQLPSSVTKPALTSWGGWWSYSMTGPSVPVDSYRSTFIDSKVYGYGVRPDYYYNTRVYDFKIWTKNCDGQSWGRPVNSAWGTPTLQLYSSSNLVMRNNFTQFYFDEMNSNPIPVEATTLNEKISWFLRSSYHGDFVTYLQDNGFTYKNIVNINGEYEQYDLLTEQPQNWNTTYVDYYTKDNQGHYVSLSEEATAPAWATNKYYSRRTGLGITFVYEKTGHDEVSVVTGPVFEQTGKSELRLHDGAVLKVETIEGDTKLTIGNGVDQEITFTFQELQALKALLTNSVTSTTVNAIESVQTMPQNPAQDTVYIVEGNQ